MFGFSQLIQPLRSYSPSEIDTPRCCFLYLFVFFLFLAQQDHGDMNTRCNIAFRESVGFSGTPTNGTPYPYHSHTTPIRTPKDMGPMVWVPLVWIPAKTIFGGPMSLGPVPGSHHPMSWRVTAAPTLNSEFASEKLLKSNRKPDRLPLPAFFRGKLAVKLRGVMFIDFKEP